MRVLVIGGAGFLGSCLDKKLIQEGHEVAVCDNFSGSIRLRSKQNSNLFVADASQYNTLYPVFKKFSPDTVIVTIGHHFEQGTVYKFFQETKTILNSANIISWLLNKNVKYVYYCSSYEVYGGPDAKRPIKETRKISKSTSHSGAAELAAEKILSFRCQELRIPLTILRVFNLYGPRIVYSPRSDILSFIVDSFLRGEQIGISQMEKAKDFIHVDDAAEAVLTLIKKEYSGTVNIGSGEGISLKEICEEIGNLMPVYNKPLSLPPGKNRFFSAVADTSVLSGLGWKPEKNLIGFLPELISFRKKELGIEDNSTNVTRTVRGA